MSWRRAIPYAAVIVAGCSGAPSRRPLESSSPRPAHGAREPEPTATRTRALETMKRATTFMVERVSYRGGYVWSYLPDMSRRWGEMEAYATMIWVQPPGTATVGQIRKLDVEGLRARYLELNALSAEQATRNSPFLAPPATQGKAALPRFFTAIGLPMSDMTRRSPSRDEVSRKLVLRLSEELNEAGYWPTKLERISHPYRGPGPREVTPGDFSETEVGDEYDTSPYRSENAPLGISTRAYVKNMSKLIRYVVVAK